MLYNARFMFTNNMTEIHRQLREPESVKQFWNNHISPVTKEDSGNDIEMEFIEAISECQFDGFVLGFNTAVKFMLGCVMEEGLNV